MTYKIVTAEETDAFMNYIHANTKFGIMYSYEIKDEDYYEIEYEYTLDDMTNSYKLGKVFFYLIMSDKDIRTAGICVSVSEVDSTIYFDTIQDDLDEFVEIVKEFLDK